ncbi:hypothetical protein ACE1OE_23205 [Vibrio sp. E150_011]
MKSQRVATRGGKLRRVATERLIVVGKKTPTNSREQNVVLK